MHEYPPGLMGPIIGMSPDKKAEFTGSQGMCGAGTLPEAESASSPLATSLDRIGPAVMVGVSGMEPEDDELTNLNWLHENLLQNFTLGGPEAPPCNAPLFDIEGSAGLPQDHGLSSSSSVSSGSPGGERDPLKSKPPFSFSLLIYMAIEQSPSKSLPVKDIYGWILEHFPYFSSAPTGWKNSVRHNLSLNKCFRKVERSLGKTNGKGSLWCVHPEFRPTLMQALKKQHFPNAHAFCTPPASPPSASSPPHLFSLEQGYSLKESDFDAATAMMLLKSASEHHIASYDQEGPIDLSRRVLVSRDPKQDHNYSSAPMCSPPRQTSPCQAAASGPGSRLQQERGGWPPSAHGPPRSSLPGKRARRESRPELDEELKEAAGSLLHLAGICTSLGTLRGKSRKLSRK
ncbi:forkhead box protein N2b isoform X2 [Electrophorus electricus]|uniref:Fork-head domain-containing protein n=1 Tax=Electrophorus electricus TaxID=8005 RepID=A0A4W4GAX6_ELEEL|nr:forkhead box protein N2b isoform X2 [Electrophorus electricus]